jgi:hypothetical protein
MEKLFRPNKWFVAFCGLLIVVFFSLQYVSQMRLKSLAEAWGVQVFTWDWPGQGLHSSAKMTKAEVVKKTESDAILKVTGTQTVDRAGEADLAKKRTETACGALLTFYKSNNDWVLGKVELQ